MTELVKPDYRVRLFLSVDLTGSTNFKSKSDQTSLIWLKAFQKFYGEFPSMFEERYRSACDQIPDIGNDEKIELPKVWKTIGDEILFVNRVNSVTHLGAYISAFADTLKDFGREIFGTHQLNTKGNGWIAAFPSPNCSIGLSRGGTDPLSGSHDLLTEEFEAKVDAEPHKFDFLGKGIDGGFRIARNSTIDTFTISPALALLLCRAKRNLEITCFECDFQFHEPQQLKGVVDGKHYPIVSIDTNRDVAQKEIHNLQAELLMQPATASHDVLEQYLEKYIDYHRIEKPALRLSHASAQIEAPDYYVGYLEQWNIEAENLKAVEANEQEAGEAQGDVVAVENGNVTLHEAFEVFSKIIDAFSGSQGKPGNKDEPE